MHSTLAHRVQMNPPCHYDGRVRLSMQRLILRRRVRSRNSLDDSASLTSLLLSLNFNTIVPIWVVEIWYEVA